MPEPRVGHATGSVAAPLLGGQRPWQRISMGNPSKCGSEESFSEKYAACCLRAGSAPGGLHNVPGWSSLSDSTAGEKGSQGRYVVSGPRRVSRHRAALTPQDVLKNNFVHGATMQQW